MVRHIVMWNFNDSLSEEEKKQHSIKMKEELENLKGIVDGIISLEVIRNPLSSSNMDILLFSEFDSNEALKAYQCHAEHIKVSNYVSSIACNRTCFDY
jgi:heme-degrading monooxygenase HmoA